MDHFSFKSSSFMICLARHCSIRVQTKSIFTGCKSMLVVYGAPSVAEGTKDLVGFAMADFKLRLTYALKKGFHGFLSSSQCKQFLNPGKDKYTRFKVTLEHNCSRSGLIVTKLGWSMQQNTQLKIHFLATETKLLTPHNNLVHIVMTLCEVYNVK